MASSQLLEQRAGPKVAPAAHGPSDVGIRPDQHGQHRLQGFGVKGPGGELGAGDRYRDRSPGLAGGAGMRIRNQPAQRPVAGAVVVAVRKHHHPAGKLGAEVAVVVENREVNPHNGIDAGSHAGLEVLDGAVEPVPVSAGKAVAPSAAADWASSSGQETP